MMSSSEGMYFCQLLLGSRCRSGCSASRIWESRVAAGTTDAAAAGAGALAATPAPAGEVEDAPGEGFEDFVSAGEVEDAPGEVSWSCGGDSCCTSSSSTAGAALGRAILAGWIASLDFFTWIFSAGWCCVAGDGGGGTARPVAGPERAAGAGAAAAGAAALGAAGAAASRAAASGARLRTGAASTTGGAASAFKRFSMLSRMFFSSSFDSTPAGMLRMMSATLG